MLKGELDFGEIKCRRNISYAVFHSEIQ